MNWIIILGIISALAITTSIIQSYLLYRVYKKPADTPPPGEKATYFLDDCESGKNCSICLGRIGSGFVRECSCGKISHEECASYVDACPYCNTPFKGVATRPAVTAKCPLCDSELEHSLCVCGALYTKRDGSIVCTCGSLIDSVRKPCSNCRAFYGKGGIHILSESISIKTEN